MNITSATIRGAMLGALFAGGVSLSGVPSAFAASPTSPVLPKVFRLCPLAHPPAALRAGPVRATTPPLVTGKTVPLCASWSAKNYSYCCRFRRHRTRTGARCPCITNRHFDQRPDDADAVAGLDGHQLLGRPCRRRRAERPSPGVHGPQNGSATCGIIFFPGSRLWSCVPLTSSPSDIPRGTPNTPVAGPLLVAGGGTSRRRPPIGGHKYPPSKRPAGRRRLDPFCLKVVLATGCAGRQTEKARGDHKNDHRSDHRRKHQHRQHQQHEQGGTTRAPRWNRLITAIAAGMAATTAAAALSFGAFADSASAAPTLLRSTWPKRRLSARRR